MENRFGGKSGDRETILEAIKIIQMRDGSGLYQSSSDEVVRVVAKKWNDNCLVSRCIRRYNQQQLLKDRMRRERT